MKISIKYSDHLKATAQQLTGKRGSDNVRAHLLGAAAEILENREKLDFTVAELYTAVGISRATFYLHFSGKTELLQDMAKGLSEFELTLTPSLASESTGWEGLFKLVEWRVRFLRENLYLTEACASFSDTTREVNEVWYAFADRRRRRFVDELARFEEFSQLDDDFINATIDVIGRGLTGLMYSLGGKQSAWSFESNRLKVEELPHFFCTMIYRALLGTDAK